MAHSDDFHRRTYNQECPKPDIRGHSGTHWQFQVDFKWHALAKVSTLLLFVWAFLAYMARSCIEELYPYFHFLEVPKSWSFQAFQKQFCNPVSIIQHGI